MKLFAVSFKTFCYVEAGNVNEAERWADAMVIATTGSERTSFTIEEMDPRYVKPKTVHAAELERKP